MTAFNIPSVLLSNQPVTWLSTIDGYTTALYDLDWLFNSTRVRAISGSGANQWSTTYDFAPFGYSAQSWCAIAINKATHQETELGSGTIKIETEAYRTSKEQLTAVNAAITKILQGGAIQTLSIKGRSRSTYGLTELRNLANELRSDIARIEGRGGQVLVRF